MLLMVNATTEFCTSLKEQRNKLHIHTLIHVFSPDLGLAYYKLKENVHVIQQVTTHYYFLTPNCMQFRSILIIKTYVPMYKY